MLGRSPLFLLLELLSLVMSLPEEEGSTACFSMSILLRGQPCTEIRGLECYVWCLLLCVSHRPLVCIHPLVSGDAPFFFFFFAQTL